MSDAVLFAGLGALGVRCLELLEYAKLPKTQKPNLADVWFWVPWIVGIALAALLALAYEKSHVELTSIIALNIGASAPLAFRTLASIVPTTPPPTPPGA